MARMVLILNMMKKMMESIKTFMEELKHEIDVYLTIQRYINLSKKSKRQ